MTPSSDNDSSRAIAGQFLCFAGLITTCAGALALIRTGEPSLFFAVLMPIGMVMWAVGRWMRAAREDGK